MRLHLISWRRRDASSAQHRHARSRPTENRLAVSCKGDVVQQPRLCFSCLSFREARIPGARFPSRTLLSSSVNRGMCSQGVIVSTLLLCAKTQKLLLFVTLGFRLAKRS